MVRTVIRRDELGITPVFPAGMPLWLSQTLLAAASGLLMAAAPPPLGQWWAAPLGAGLLGLAVFHAGFWRGFWLGTVGGFTYFLPTLYFIAFSLETNWVWFLLSGFEALFVGAAGAVTGLALKARTWPALPSFPEQRRLGLSQVLIASAVWALCFAGLDVLRSYYPWGGLAWANLSYTQVDGPLLGYVRYLSSAGLVALVVFLGTAAVLAVRSTRPTAIAVAGILAATALFSPRLAPLNLEAGAPTIKVAAVQGNVNNPGMDAFLIAAEVSGNHAEETKRAGRAAQERGWALDMVLWPENAADLDPRAHQEIADLVSDAYREVNAPIAVGAVRYERIVAGAEGGAPAVAPGPRGAQKKAAAETSSTLVRYNDVVVFDGAKYGEVYTKQVPAPFAEFLPLRSLVTQLTDLSDLLSIDMLPGQKPAVLPIPAAQLGRDVNVGVGICFEVGVGSVMRQAARGEFLYIPTNNSNFGYTAESEQQLDMTRLRAAEFDRSAVQISTVGVSGVVGPDGALLDKRDLFSPAHLLFEVPVGNTALTPAAKWGGHVEAALVFAVALTCLLGLLRSGQARLAKAESVKRKEARKSYNEV
ncbi:MAG: apolipoprotein N-acyltransferase [Buchananella hordeovulneris]|nr:apolipoprotein N-acyltransferase [Buchananella hordeovulneris]